MSNPAWKALERRAAALFGGKRFWSNSGEAIDFEGPDVTGQVKGVQSLSLEALTALVETADVQAKARGKVGVVCAKVRRGKGAKSPMLVVFSEEGLREYRARIKAAACRRGMEAAEKWKAPGGAKEAEKAPNAWCGEPCSCGLPNCEECRPENFQEEPT